jgi:Holliday junction resolvase RusA-like endonuclease
MVTILEIHLKSQVRGGKNNMKMTRTGKHYPDPKFVEWRNRMFAQIKEQWPAVVTIKDKSHKWYFEYTPEDNKRRDIPAILDAVFHVLERSFIVSDDSIIKNIEFTELPIDNLNSGILIQVF